MTLNYPGPGTCTVTVLDTVKVKWGNSE